jgi:phage repressor protein C with HTH and peptisase S24 domain
MSYEATVKRRLKSVRQVCGLSQEELARRIGTSNQHIGRLEKERGGAHLSLEWIEKLAIGLNVPVSTLLLDGENDNLPVTASPSGFSMIPRYEIHAAAGTGLSVLTEDVIDALAFRTDWLRRIGVEPARAGLVQAHGDSMAPTITDGALMLVDMREDQPVRHGCIYVILRDGDLIVKRVDRSADDGTVALISDNKRYRKQIVTIDQLADMRIPGRVVWVGTAL